MARSEKGSRGLFVWHDSTGAENTRRGRSGNGRSRGGESQECSLSAAGRGNKPRPASAGPGAGGSGRLRAGRRREGSGLTELREPEPATPPARVRGAALLPNPPPRPRRPRRRQSRLRERGGRQNPGRMDVRIARRVRSGGRAIVPLRRSPPGWRGCRVPSPAGREKIWPGQNRLRLPGPEDVRAPRAVSGKVIFSRLSCSGHRSRSKSGGGCASISGRVEEAKSRPYWGNEGCGVGRRLRSTASPPDCSDLGVSVCWGFVERGHGRGSVQRPWVHPLSFRVLTFRSENRHEIKLKFFNWHLVCWGCRNRT